MFNDKLLSIIFKKVDLDTLLYYTIIDCVHSETILFLQNNLYYAHVHNLKITTFISKQSGFEINVHNIYYV